MAVMLQLGSYLVDDLYSVLSVNNLECAQCAGTQCFIKRTPFWFFHNLLK